MSWRTLLQAGWVLLLPIACSPSPTETSLKFMDIPGAREHVKPYLRLLLKEHHETRGHFWLPVLHVKSECDVSARIAAVKATPQIEDDENLMTDVLAAPNLDCLTQRPLIYWLERDLLLTPVFVYREDIENYEMLYLEAGLDMTLESMIRQRVPPHAVIDMGKDVVATEEEIGGSTYLTTETWAYERMWDALDGTRIIVER